MKNLIPTLEEITLAALLHDIGKFAQRTGQQNYRSNDEDLLCPYISKGNYYTHQHVLFTDGFLNSYKNIFPVKFNRNLIITTAAKHHKPDSSFEWIVTIADRLSSGSDRMSKNSEEEKQKYFEQPLKSIFSKVNIPGRNKADSYYHNLIRLSAESSFPEKNVAVNRESYSQLWKEFENDFAELEGVQYESEDFLSLIDNLLLHYTWSIPSSTIDEPDISLYDHLVTTAALAAVLYKFHSTKGTLQDVESVKDSNEEKFLFVSGDLSGIQKYIFDSSQNRAKLLRAKSFEIQAFSTEIGLELLRRLGLPHFCKVMDAGGRFLLLLPNTDETKEILEDFRYEVEQWCVKKYFGQLTLNLSQGIPASGKDLLQEHASELFERIAKDVRESKYKKLQTYLNKNSFLIEDEYEKIHSNQDVCISCGKRVKVAGKDYCAFCNDLIKFGENIPKNRFIGIDKLSDKKGLNLFQNTKISTYKTLQDIPDYLFPNILNRYDPKFVTLYTPFHLPTNENEEVMTFEEIASEAEGKNYIAMIKADVDNLGLIFSKGFGNRISLSRFASLSRMLNFFFSAYIHNKLVNDFQTLYTVFSGGDDLSIIGPWDEIIDFASELMNDFSRYTGFNESLSISCGVVLAGTKLPVRNIAVNAEEALEKAKRHKPGKVYIFKTVADKEKFDSLIQAANELYQYMTNSNVGKLSSQIVYRFMKYGEQKKKMETGSLKSEDALWASHFSYDTARNINKEHRDKIRKFVLKYIDDISFVASYALYKNRKKEGRI